MYLCGQGVLSVSYRAVICPMGYCERAETYRYHGLPAQVETDVAAEAAAGNDGSGGLGGITSGSRHCGFQS